MQEDTEEKLVSKEIIHTHRAHAQHLQIFASILVNTKGSAATKIQR